MFLNYHDIKYRNTEFYRNLSQDGFINTAQRAWEFEELIKIYEKLAPSRVLEIGSWYGGTLHEWIRRIQPNGVIVNIDNMLDVPEGVREETLQRWISWTPPSVTYHPLIGDSTDSKICQQAHDLLGGKIDFLFIAGDHSYQGVKSDFNMYGPLVRKGGVIALHDITKLTAGNATTPVTGLAVLQLWRDIQEAGYVTQELRINLNTCGIGVVYV